VKTVVVEKRVIDEKEIDEKEIDKQAVRDEDPAKKEALER
jgi:hypothetical protein